jgi:hypothetical protein
MYMPSRIFHVKSQTVHKEIRRENGGRLKEKERKCDERGRREENNKLTKFFVTDI